jgi:hypothetical protein
VALARHLTDEILDHLPADDPRAIASRRDLKRINLLMGQALAMRGLLIAVHGKAPPRAIVELGGGDGSFMLKVARGLSRHWRGVTLTLVDQQRIVSAGTEAAFADLGWTLRVVTADIFGFLETCAPQSANIICANLVLHHFSQSDLRRLFAASAAAGRGFAACEPRRSQLALAATRFLPAIGCNDVTRHDAPASVRAGFRGTELSALWPREGWTLIEGAGPMFTHRFGARRNG